MRLSEAVRRLREAGVDDPLFDARALFSGIGGFSPAGLLGTDPECDLPSLTSAVARREAREPLQYILGEVGFYREIYLVNKDCLIPRADTELLVETAIGRLRPGAHFLDLCCGSGCIALSVLAHTTDTRAEAIDLSPGALTVAGRNAARLGLTERVSFRQADVLTYLPSAPVHAVLSNPPYVSESAYATLAPEIGYEPRMAFLGGQDGGDFYRALIPRYRDLLLPGGFLAFEIGYDQGGLLRDLAAAHGFGCEILPDLGGHDRVALLTH